MRRLHELDAGTQLPIQVPPVLLVIVAGHGRAFRCDAGLQHNGAAQRKGAPDDLVGTGVALSTQGRIAVKPGRTGPVIGGGWRWTS